MILVLSIFVPAQEVSNIYVRNIALTVLFSGLFIWFYKHIIYILYTIGLFDFRKDELNSIKIFDIFVQAIIWLLVFLFYFA